MNLTKYEISTVKNIRTSDISSLVYLHIKSYQIKSNHLLMQKKQYFMNLIFNHNIKYYFPQLADSIAWGCFSFN